MSKILNLVDIDKSDIKYQIQKFPDGQQNIVLKHVHLEFGYRHLPIQIKSRLNNWLDLELIVCAVASLRELGTEEIHLYTPYIMGARSDRKFEQGGNNYLKDVICPVINSLNFKTVTCIDPHSDVLEACINRFRKDTIGQFGLFKWSVGKIYNDILPKVGGELKDIEGKYILISPDAGASKKIYKLAEQIGYKGDIITCSKDRDNNGNLTKTVVPIEHKHIRKDYTIIDDICDGGATFINIAKELKAHMQNDLHAGKIYLIVTHSIFSKGTDELLKYFDGIYTTNSYQDLNPDTQSFVKQLNVF